MTIQENAQEATQDGGGPEQRQVLFPGATPAGFGVAQKIKFDPGMKFVLPEEKLSVICQAIQNTMSEVSCPVIYFASPYAREGSGAISFECALVAALRLGKRTLFIDMSRARRGLRHEMAEGTDKPIGRLDPLQLSMLEETDFYYANIAGENISAVVFKTMLDTFRKRFELVIVNGESGLTNSLTAASAGFGDGVILVLEAERTRAPVALRLKKNIELGGGRIIGAVLNRQRYHIPSFVYFLFFKSYGRAR